MEINKTVELLYSYLVDKYEQKFKDTSKENYLNVDTLRMVSKKVAGNSRKYSFTEVYNYRLAFNKNNGKTNKENMITLLRDKFTVKVIDYYHEIFGVKDMVRQICTFLPLHEQFTVRSTSKAFLLDASELQKLKISICMTKGSPIKYLLNKEDSVDTLKKLISNGGNFFTKKCENGEKKKKYYSLEGMILLAMNTSKLGCLSYLLYSKPHDCHKELCDRCLMVLDKINNYSYNSTMELLVILNSNENTVPLATIVSYKIRSSFSHRSDEVPETLAPIFRKIKRSV